MGRIISVYKLSLQPVMVGLGLKSKNYGLNLGLATLVLDLVLGIAVPDLGLSPCGIVNILAQQNT